MVIFNQSLALNSHLKGQHENLNHHYIQLSVLSNAGGLPLQERTSNGVDGTCPFCPLEATWPKITAAKTVEVNICSHSNINYLAQVKEVGNSLHLALYYDHLAANSHKDGSTVHVLYGSMR